VTRERRATCERIASGGGLTCGSGGKKADENLVLLSFFIGVEMFRIFCNLTLEYESWGRCGGLRIGDGRLGGGLRGKQRGIVEADFRVGADLPRVARGEGRMVVARRRRHEDGCHVIGGG
jgi:hypothetical protein